MERLLTIAIPTYKNLQQLNWCLTSLMGHTEYPYKVVIVSNSPEDKAVLEQFVSTNPYGDVVSVKHMGYNAGWMGAINAALQDCDTPYFCMCNDDVVFLPGKQDFWRALIQPFNDPRVGAVGPCSNFVAGAQSLFQLGVATESETSLLIGFCMVVRTQVLKDLGGLDAGLPGGDDLDLSIRLMQAGYSLRIVRSAYLHHIGQQTGKRVRPDWDNREHQEASNNALIQKHGVKAWYEVMGGGWRPAAHLLQLDDPERKAMDDFLGRFVGGKGLDVGCGGNKHSHEGVEIVGVDRREVGEYGMGGARVSPANPDIVADASDLPFGCDSQDFVIASHVLEHIPDMVAALDEWKRVLKPGGGLLVHVPNQDKLETRLMDCTHCHVFVPGFLHGLLEAAGFKVESVEEVGMFTLSAVARKESR